MSIQKLFSKWFLPLTLVAGIVLYFSFLGQKDFSLDELSTFVFTRNWSNLMHIIHFSEGNMWLYYIILYFWSKASIGEFWLRSLSTLFAIMSIPLVYALSKKLATETTAKITTILYLLNVFVIQNAQNARSYTLLLLLTTASCYFFISYLQKPSKINLLLFNLLNILAVYTHLYAVFIIALQLISSLIWYKKSNWRYIAGAFLLTLPFYIPYAIAPSLHSGQINWITKPDIRQVIKTYLILSYDFLPLALLTVLLFGNYALKLWGKRKELFHSQDAWKQQFLVLWTIVPVACAYIFSLVGKPMYQPMYFIICVVPFTLLLAISITHIKRNSLKIGIITLFFLLSAVRLYGWYASIPSLGFMVGNKNEDWRQTNVFLSKHATLGDAIIYFPPYVLPYSAIYAQKDSVSFNGAQVVVLQPYGWQAGHVTGNINATALKEISKKYSRVWYVLGDYSVANRIQEKAQIEGMLATNYKQKQKNSFSLLTIYEFDK